jgi:NADP-dependent 3-hydroxy acid dehydrogenase YdfG
MASDRDHGRAAVISGASLDIGTASARRLGADGHPVGLPARRADRAQPLADSQPAA